MSMTGLTLKMMRKQPDPCIPSNIHQRKNHGSLFRLFFPDLDHQKMWVVEFLSDLQANDEHRTVDSSPE